MGRLLSVSEAQIWIGLLLATLTLGVMIWGFGFRMGKLFQRLDLLTECVDRLMGQVEAILTTTSNHQTEIAVIKSKFDTHLKDCD